jgi:hypothetical protein
MFWVPPARGNVTRTRGSEAKLRYAHVSKET